jgi:hypothetical protein
MGHEVMDGTFRQTNLTNESSEYLASNSVLELNEAAYLLGFHDPNSFGRAFRAGKKTRCASVRQSLGLGFDGKVLAVKREHA